MTLNNVNIYFKILDGKIKRLKHAVMRSYSLFASNVYIYIYINDAKLQESWIIKRYMYINIRMNK